MPLTDTAIRALKPKATRYSRTDERGLVLEVFPTGGMLWHYRYRLNGKQERVTLGRYPALSLKLARAERDKRETLARVPLFRGEREGRCRAQSWRRANGVCGAGLRRRLTAARGTRCDRHDARDDSCPAQPGSPSGLRERAAAGYSYSSDSTLAESARLMPVSASPSPQQRAPKPASSSATRRPRGRRSTLHP